MGFFDNTEKTKFWHEFCPFFQFSPQEFHSDPQIWFPAAPVPRGSSVARQEPTFLYCVEYYLSTGMENPCRVLPAPQVTDPGTEVQPGIFPGEQMKFPGENSTDPGIPWVFPVWVTVFFFWADNWCQPLLRTSIIDVRDSNNDCEELQRTMAANGNVAANDEMTVNGSEWQKRMTKANDESKRR